MKPEERQRMYELCAMIEKEQDHERFLQLIEELNTLLERKEHRLEGKNKG
jgi:ribosomal protein S6